MAWLIQWELSLLHLIQDSATAVSDVFWTSVTMLGESGIFWIALSLLLMLIPKTRKAGFTMGLALLLGVIFGNAVLKNAVARPRPYDLDPTLFCRLAWGEMSTDFSFPSGHTLASFEAAAGLFLYHKKWGSVALCAALLVMLSRLFLVVHYPTDLLAGALLGILFALLSAKAIGFLYAKFEERKAMGGKA